MSGRFSIDWTKTFKRIKIPRRKRDCLDGDKGKNFSDCAINCKMNCSNCETVRSCKLCLDLVSQKKTCSTNINMLKGEPANEYYQLLSYYEGKYEPRQDNIDFESTKEVSLSAEKPMIEKSRFEKTYDMIACKSYIKYEDIPEKKRDTFYGFNTLKQKKIDKYILVGCESEVIYKNIKLFNF